MKARYAAILLMVTLVPAPASVAAEAPMSRADVEAIVSTYLKTHPDEIGALVKAYVVRHPDVVRDVLVEVAKSKAQTQRAGADKLAADRAQTIAAEAETLFASPHQALLGDPDGDVTLVEFFDYNCAFCRRALADTVALLGSDPHLRLILKDLPILGPQSVDAAQVAVAARMQGAPRDRYFAFHRQLLALHEPVTSARALSAAREAGFDMERLQRDMTSAEVATTLKENMRLASALHITGTPTYVAGTKVFVGAIGADLIKTQIAALRQGAKQSQ